MKLAEALIRRSDTQKRVQQLQDRIARSSKVQEGDEPPENPLHLLEELDRALEDLVHLIKSINRTNSVTMLDEGMSLADALAERDILALKRKILIDTIVEATSDADTGYRHSGRRPPMRYSKSELRYIRQVDVEDLQKQADDLARRHRELDTRIQETNWTVELIEE